MINKTYTSDLSSIIKLPSHINLNAEFIYNFFQIDEALVEGSLPGNFDTRTDSSLRLLPRYNRLTFSKPILPSHITSATYSEGTRLKILNNLQYIYSCEDVGNVSNTTLVVQDVEMNETIYQMLMRSASIRQITGNMSDISMKLGRAMPKLSAENKENLQKLSNSYDKAGSKFIKDTKILVDMKFENFDTASSTVTINDKFLADLLSSAERNSWLGNSTAVGLNKTKALKIQNKARFNQPYVISETNYDTILVPIECIESSGIDSIKHIATLVYRREITSNGYEKDTDVKLIDILSPEATNYNDYRIKIDAKYHYWLHALYEVELESVSREDSLTFRSRLLFQSLPSDSASIYTRDNTPPSNPVQFDINWDYQHYNVVLHWNFPVCKTRDIKYFQIYRRMTVDEPFELLQEYDFNDSNKKPNRIDGILPSKIKTTKIPLKYYVDKSFGKDSSYIYAITCMDARGLISNYSEQIQVSFDRIKNKLVKKVISKSGAPMQYPNVFLEQAFFQDTIRTTKKSEMQIFFDPEYLKIKASNGSIIDGLLTKEYGTYSINILDVNRAQIASIPLTITDLTDLQKK